MALAAVALDDQTRRRGRVPEEAGPDLHELGREDPCERVQLEPHPVAGPHGGDRSREPALLDEERGEHVRPRRRQRRPQGLADRRRPDSRRYGARPS